MEFLEKNFDSTIIYQGWSSWYPHADYDIIAKKEDKVYFFTYKSPYRLTKGRWLPGGLELKFLKDQLEFETTEPDTNRYFLYVNILSANRQSNWRTINGFGIWRLTEVDYSGSKCDSEDGGTDTFYLITKDSFKALNYYDAEFFESCAPPNANRNKAIQLRKAFLDIFNGCH